MNDCWKCDETLDVQGNYCTQCGAPQKPSSAAQSFTWSTNDFYRGLDNILDLVEGCPEMLAEGLAEMDGYGDISAAEWERRFENSFKWLRGYFYRLWLSRYDLSEEELEEAHRQHDRLPESAGNRCRFETQGDHEGDEDPEKECDRQIRQPPEALGPPLVWYPDGDETGSEKSDNKREAQPSNSGYRRLKTHGTTERRAPEENEYERLREDEEREDRPTREREDLYSIAIHGTPQESSIPSPHTGP